MRCFNVLGTRKTLIKDLLRAYSSGMKHISSHTLLLLDMRYFLFMVFVVS